MTTHPDRYRQTRDWAARRIAESLALNWILDMHDKGEISEGQCCAKLNMERVAFRKMVDEHRDAMILADMNREEPQI